MPTKRRKPVKRRPHPAEGYADLIAGFTEVKEALCRAAVAMLREGRGPLSEMLELTNQMLTTLDSFIVIYERKQRKWQLAVARRRGE